jgi:aspartyl protease family protein
MDGLRSHSAGRGLRAALAAGALTLAECAAAAAQSVALSGTMGDRKAVLVIDGQPHTLGVGESRGSVKLLGLADGQAQVAIDGRREVLRIGQAPVRLGGSGSAASSGRQIVLTAGLGGHFTSVGSINGRTVNFLVDTGATAVSIGRGDAQRLGLNIDDAPRGTAHTANGAITVHRVMLGVVRVGDVEVHNVEAVVMPGAMPHVLLGNSFLTRFQMRRENDQLTLDKRP